TDNKDSNEDFLNYNKELFNFDNEILIEKSSEKVSNNTLDEIVNEGLNNE
ncbi:14439_t:CDS:1, partial [Funneliformis mosseae]